MRSKLHFLATSGLRDDLPGARYYYPYSQKEDRTSH